jgi:NADPH:quinone reductase-like Zn-dependent oxidoreductase
VRRFKPGDEVYARPADGRIGAFAELIAITSLIDDGVIRPVVDRVFPFASTKEAMAYVEAGRAKGKIIVSLRES